MHYLTLITAEIPEITEDEQTNEAVKAQIDKLENEKESFPENHLVSLTFSLQPATASGMNFPEQLLLLQLTYWSRITVTRKIRIIWSSGIRHPNWKLLMNKALTVSCFRRAKSLLPGILPYTDALPSVMGTYMKPMQVHYTTKKEPKQPNESKPFRIIRLRSSIWIFPIMQRNTGESPIILNRKLMDFTIIQMLF